MTWQAAALTFAGLVAIAHWFRWVRRLPRDFTHLHKMERFKEYQRERDEELRRKVDYRRLP